MFGISIVVVSYNSAAIIEPTIQAILAQENTSKIPWEVILVNNKSTDDTVSIVRSLIANKAEIDFKIVDETKPGTAFARFKGVNEAKYDIICFVDDDNRIANNWVNKVAELMQNPEIGILGCGGKGDFEQTPPAWFEAEQLAYAVGALYSKSGLTDTTTDANLPTAGMCIRKEIFENLAKQNWKAQLTGRIGSSMAPGEDTELCQAARLLGYKTFYTSDLHFTHYMPKNRITWERFLAMTYGFGVTDVFLLPYRLIYEKRKFGANLKYTIRKQWYINYLGKKITLVIAYINLKLGRLSQADFEKIKARNTGFCDTIWKQKENFAKAFEEVNTLKLVI